MVNSESISNLVRGDIVGLTVRSSSLHEKAPSRPLEPLDLNGVWFSLCSGGRRRIATCARERFRDIHLLSQSLIGCNCHSAMSSVSADSTGRVA
jgi:hypothetical protein